MENIKIKRGESVIDIGAGSGILSIAAAKLGGRVFATDSSKEAVVLVKNNAHRNKIRIEVSKGSYFADFKGKFDVIIANLPSEIVHPSYLKAIGAKLAKTIDGGNNGNEVLLRFLDQTKKRMHSKSRLYITTSTTNDFYTVIKKILKNYKSELLSFKAVPTKEFIRDNIKYYRKLVDEGKIIIFKRKGVWHEFAFLWELSLLK